MLKQIIDKMETEFKEYTNKLMSLEKVKIIENSYQYSIKKELFDMFKCAYHYDYYLCISYDNLEKLSRLETPLAFLYDEWLDADIHINSQLNDFLEILHF